MHVCYDTQHILVLRRFSFLLLALQMRKVQLHRVRVLLLDSSVTKLLLLLLLHWMSVSGLRARSRDAQAAVESDLLINYIYKEIIKARPIKLQKRSIYKLIIRSDSAFQLSTAYIHLVQF